MRPFRSSLGGVAWTGAALALCTWLVLWRALGAGARPAAAITVAALGVLVAVRLTLWPEGYTVRLTPYGLDVRDPSAARHVPWGAITRVALVADDAATPRGGVPIRCVRLELAHGPPLHFADLSAVGRGALPLADGRGLVLDVEDPEILLGVVAEQVGAQEFLPRTPVARAGGTLRLAPHWSRGAARAVLLLVLVGRVAEALQRVPLEQAVSALAGFTGVVALTTVVHALSARLVPGVRQAAAAALTLVVALGVGVAVRVLSRDSAFVDAGCWALATSLTCALPVHPLPGAALARFVGARVPHDAALALLATLAGVATAALIGAGGTILPLALGASAFEVHHGYRAAARQARLAGAPAFAQWPAEALAKFGELLRAVPPDARAVRRTVLERESATAADDAADESRAERGWLVVVLLAVLAAAAIGRAAYIGADPRVAAAVRVCLG